MKVALVQYTSADISNQIIIDFSNSLTKQFSKINYGNDIKSVIIGIICVSPNFDQFFKVRKPKYTKDKKNVVSEGFKYEIEKCLEYDVKLDFETFKNGTEEESRKLLAKEIMNSLSVLDDMKKKIKDFDSEKFKADLESYFEKNGLL